MQEFVGYAPKPPELRQNQVCMHVRACVFDYEVVLCPQFSHTAIKSTIIFHCPCYFLLQIPYVQYQSKSSEDFLLEPESPMMRGI